MARGKKSARRSGWGLWLACLFPMAPPLVIVPASAQTTGNPQSENCSADSPPTPMAVEVTAVPVVVASTTADYFVLYVRHELDADSSVEIPVLVKRGEAGTTTLAENVEALPKERYRVEKYLIADPADVDGDCIDDITELDDFGTRNPVNAATSLDMSDGAVGVPDWATFAALGVQSLGATYGKFALVGSRTEIPRVYFLNSNTHPGHYAFLKDVLGDGGLEQNVVQALRGDLTYYPSLEAADGSLGVYVASDSITYSFSEVERLYTVIAANMPLLERDLAYHLYNDQLFESQDELPLYEASRIPLVFEEDIRAETDFVPLNGEVGFGLLRALEPDERPGLRDVVIYETLPNNLPRVAGIISTVRQTPLSHVNLRAIQDGVPNAYIRDALEDDDIDALVGSYVRYEVTEAEYSIRAASREEVDAHYESSRPATPQAPQRDLSVTEISPLSDIGFDGWDAFGVKAANVAELRKLGFPDGTVPDGFAIPFYFYDEFMKANGLYEDLAEMMADEGFQTNLATQSEKLGELRDAIEAAETPAWIIEKIVAMNAGFPDGINRRYRSSTNNEDLPGFNGAGLYDSKTQKAKEDEKDLAKSLKEVYASLWNFRAFVERDFHRIDHHSAAMGVLVHPSYQDELVNGVAVSFDPIFGREGSYYVNSQVGEDLVTNPDAHSVPEELLLTTIGDLNTVHAEVLATSNQVKPGALLMSEDQLGQLRERIQAIHDHFAGLYAAAGDEPFAMEIEFKITSENALAIKQARPWVFGGDGDDEDQRDDGNSGGGGGGGGGSDGGGGGGGGGGGPPPSDDQDDEDDEDDEDDGGGGGGVPPRAAITVDAECADGLCRARTGAAVRFEDSSSGSVRLRRWEFGDGSRRSNRTVDYAWSAPGFYDVTLWTSDGTTVSTASLTFLVEASDPAGTCEADAEALCLRDSRYAVGVDWWTADGGSGSASVVHSGTNDSGLFWFFAPNNWEVLIKVLDGCALNGHTWVFGASTTDLGYTIRVTDTVTGMVKEYRNEPGLPAPAIADTTAFSQGCR